MTLLVKCRIWARKRRQTKARALFFTGEPGAGPRGGAPPEHKAAALPRVTTRKTARDLQEPERYSEKSEA